MDAWQTAEGRAADYISAAAKRRRYVATRLTETTDVKSRNRCSALAASQLSAGKFGGRYPEHRAIGCGTSLRSSTYFCATVGYISWIHIRVSMCYRADMMIKDSGMRIRVEKDLRDAFVQACRAQDRAASDVLRDFMRAFTEKQHLGQADLFLSAKQDQK